MNSSNDTKGAWTQLVAATAFDYNAMMFIANQDQGDTIGQGLFDIAIGAAGSEVLIAADILIGDGASTATAASFPMPLHIPVGSRVAVRGAFSFSSDDAEVIIIGFASGWGGARGFSRAVGLGTNAADSGGTTVSSSGSADTKGSYAELIASTADGYDCFVLTGAYEGSTSISSAHCLVDVAIGGAGSEVDIVSDNTGHLSGAFDSIVPHNALMFQRIPVASRVFVRMQDAVGGQACDFPCWASLGEFCDADRLRGALCAAGR